MTYREEWRQAYRKQRIYAGRSFVVSDRAAITNALRAVFNGQRIVHTRMNSGTPASYPVATWKERL